MGLVYQYADLIILSLFFWGVFLVSYLNQSIHWKDRSKKEKIIDIISLFIQGVVIPLVGLLFSYILLSRFFFSYKDSLSLHPALALLIPFTVIDYIYYWNHRLFHSASFWFIHRVHHSAQKIDLLVTSRNSLWTSFLLIYVWSQALFVFLLEEAFFFLVGAAISAGLDILRHSDIDLTKYENSIGRFFILPKDHHWHHSEEMHGVNYGANLNLWDKMHGTFYRSSEMPQKYGVESQGNLETWLLRPWRLK